MHVTPGLDVNAYNTIEKLMVEGNDGASLSAAIIIGLGDAPHSPDLPVHGYDHSFARQLNQLVQTPSSVDPQLPAAPEAYLLTAFSAIPVADALRGFYEELGAPLPLISWVTANMRNAKTYFYADKPRLIQDSAEVDRLKTLIEGMAHVCVIDQYVATGRTITYAGQLALAAGAEKVSGIRGRWYDEADKIEVDLEALTSTHKGFMRMVGRASCR